LAHRKALSLGVCRKPYANLQVCTLAYRKLQTICKEGDGVNEIICRSCLFDVEARNTRIKEVLHSHTGFVCGAEEQAPTKTGRDARSGERCSLPL
jgi:hypothetical protein